MKIDKFTIILLLFALIAYQFFNMGQKSVSPIEIVKTDTIIRIDTIEYIKPTPQYITKVKTIRDTLKTTDTIPQYIECNIPIEQKTYTDSNYYAVISGYKANLDTIKVIPTHTTIERIITQEKANKWHFTVSANVGVGYGLINRKPDVFIGVGVGIPLYQK